MIFGGGILLVLGLVLWLYCVFDVIATDESSMRNLPKFGWLVVVIILPTVGSLAWLLLGRPTGAGLYPGGEHPSQQRGGARRPQRSRPSAPRVQAPPKGPEDSPDFMKALEEQKWILQQWEQDLRRREEQLRKQDEEGDQTSS